MTLASREQIQQDYDALRAAVSRIQQHSYESMTNPELLGLLEAIERETRKLHVPGHQMINQLARQATADELGGKLTHALSDRLSISRAESARRIAEATTWGHAKRSPVSRWNHGWRPPRPPNARVPSEPARSR